jgi:Amt family ammonium transporter
VAFYIAGCLLLDKIHVDDAVESAPIHLFGGIWGTIATGLFSNKYGVVYGFEGSGTFFAY